VRPIRHFFQSGLAALLLIAVATLACNSAPAGATSNTGSIGGNVTAAASGAGIANIQVSAFPTNGGFIFITCSTSSGTYDITGISAGTYNVEFVSSPDECTATSKSYVPQWYKDQPTQATARSETVTAGSEITGINAALAVGGGISGVVTAAANGEPVIPYCVTLFEVGTSTEVLAQTTDGGIYEASGLAPGNYDVEFSNGCGQYNFVTQWYQNQPSQSAATPVKVTAGNTTTGISAAMVAAGSISGKVTAASGGAALNGIQVTAWLIGGNTGLSVCSFPKGEYTIIGVPTGSYDVEFRADKRCPTKSGYATQWYKNKARRANAVAVPVTAPSAITGINAALKPT
jgi:hypothetical protein